MIPTQEFENFPEFANAGEKTQPNDQKYAQGFLPSDTLPAEWQNWFLAGATRGITALDTGLSSVEAEINTVLQSRQEQPSATSTNQLLTVLEKIKAEAILAAHPVGSLYWTSKNENPAITFGGGTWKQIKDKFILAAGDTYSAGATGGNASVTLDLTQIPSHTHGLNSHTHLLTPRGTISVTTQPTFTGTEVTSSDESQGHTHVVPAHAHGLNSHTHSVGAHSHGLNSHKHSVGAHAHGLNSHTHSFTPGGSISITTNPTFTGTEVTSGASSATNTGSESSHTHTLNNGNTSSSGTTKTAGIRFISVNTSSTGEHTHILPMTKSSPGSGQSSSYYNYFVKTSVGSQNILADDGFGKGTAYHMPGSSSGILAMAIGCSMDYRQTAYYCEGGAVTLSGYHNHSVTANGYIYGKTDAGSSHSHTMAHTHKVTASGTISGGSYTFTGTNGNTGAASGNTANSTQFDTGAASGSTANSTAFDTGAASGNTANSTQFDTLGTSRGHTHKVTASGSISGGAYNFSGTRGETSAATGNTTSTGGSNGTTQAVNIMPPYEVKYCWERTA